MANFMNKVKPIKPIKPIKPVKPISEVKSPETQKIAEEKIEEIKNPEQSERKGKVSEKTEPVVEEKPAEEVIEKENVESKQEEAPPEPEPEVKPEPEPEPEVKPKSKKKSSRKKKKEEVKVEPKENKESVDLEKAEELMLDTIMPCAEGWQDEKEKINGMLSKIVITEELDPTSVKTLIADMSKTLREIIMLSTESKVALANLKDIIEEVKTVSSVGANSEERKMNAMYAIKNYEYEESIVDLTVLLKFYRERQEFYDAAIKEIEINRQMLITFGSVFKLELGKAY